jgi:hypothetical protein
MDLPFFIRMNGGGYDYTAAFNNQYDVDALAQSYSE